MEGHSFKSFLHLFDLDYINQGRYMSVNFSVLNIYAQFSFLFIV